MKQSAKTLGVAALGVAFAAAGAGAANAAPAAPAATDALGTVTSAVPLENVTSSLPAGTESLAGAQTAVSNGLNTATPVVDQAAKGALSGDGGDAVSGLLGGLPVGGLGG
ncbi:ATP-binding protein [Streptomyces sp. SDT5-1]|uniref:ATP-binding protein n=1 Tax=Streptomyces sp. SDT5-1 TaxID=3406418 RepID=UPI003FD2CD3B